MLEHVDIPWVWLKNHLDQIIDEVNQNKPLPSTTIAIDTNTSGSMLRVVGTGVSTSSSTDGGGGGGDSAAGGQWTPVVVVDPNTCMPSTLMVWAKPPS